VTAEQRQAAIDAEVDKLHEWQRNDDSASYSNILKDLTHAEKKVRFAAMEALKQFGGTNAIPVLKDLATKTDDLDETKALLETAKFLSLPPADLNSFFHHPTQNAPGAAAGQ
jgi:HEAT repeat protein